jgi:hypothetical protein
MVALKEKRIVWYWSRLDGPDELRDWGWNRSFSTACNRVYIDPEFVARDSLVNQITYSEDSKFVENLTVLKRYSL